MAIIGKVSVKVYPDTKGFKQQLQSELDKIEKSLKNLNVTIEPKLNDAAVVREARRARNTFEAQLHDLNVSFDMSQAGRDARATRDRVQAELKDLQLGIDFSNEASIRAAIARLDAELAKASETKI